MSEQLWGIGGVLAGIAATGGMNLYTEKRKAAMAAKETAKEASRELCRKFLKSIEDELAAICEYEEAHGVAPMDAGYESRGANARALLTDMELNCPTAIQSKAIALAVALEEHAWGRAGSASYEAARKEFIQAVRRL